MEVLEVHPRAEAIEATEDSREVGDRPATGRHREGRLRVEDVIYVNEEAEAVIDFNSSTSVDIEERADPLVLTEARNLTHKLIHRARIVEVGEQRERAPVVIHRCRERVFRIAKRAFVVDFRSS